MTELPADLSEQPLPRLPERPPESHKGNYGTVLLIGGSPGMSGAIALAGKATLRSGAGLVTLAVPAVVRSEVAAFDPCYMTIGLSGDPETGQLGLVSVLELSGSEQIKRTSVWGVGPGLGRGRNVAELVGRIYSDVGDPMVVDADGLSGLAMHAEVLRTPGGPRILTPHPGEFARLALAIEPDWDVAAAGRSNDHAERQRAAVWLARLDPTNRTIVVLKGHGTVIAGPECVATNQTGNPGMATGGSGDVLTGVISGLLAQGLAPWDAARLGVHLHGLAGDLAAERLGQISLMASDLVEYLPDAFQSAGGW